MCPSEKDGTLVHPNCKYEKALWEGARGEKTAARMKGKLGSTVWNGSTVKHQEAGRNMARERQTMERETGPRTEKEQIPKAPKCQGEVQHHTES